jgi:TonB family protein
MALSIPRSTGEARSSDSRGPSVPILLVSDDDQLWVKLGAALPGLRLAQHDSISDVIEQWIPAKPGVVLVDARVESALGKALENLQSNCLGLVPVALVDAQHEGAAIALERQRVLFDHLPLSLDPGTTLSVLERAGEEAESRVAAAENVAVANDGRAADDQGVIARGGRKLVLAGMVLVILAAAAGGYWFYRAKSSPPVAPAAAPSAAPAASEAQAPEPSAAAPAGSVDIEALLEKARVAMRDKRYIDPDDDNALASYRNVLAIDPANGEARQGLDRIAEVLIARAESALAAKDYPVALRALEAARSLKPDHPRLAALDAQIGQRVQDVALTQIQAALQAENFDRASTLLKQAEHNAALSANQLAALRQDLARRQAVHDGNELLRLANARLAQGRLIDPATDSAKTYLDRLASRGGDPSAELTRLRQEYQRRLGAEAHAAAARHSFGEASALLAEYKNSGAPAAQVGAIEREIQTAQQAMSVDLPRFLQLGQERVAQHRLLAPEGDNALQYYRSAVAIDAHASALPTLKNALAADLVDQARAAYAAGRASDAQPLMDAARELGVGNATLAALSSSATPAAAAAPKVVQQPRMTSALRPDYPREALAKGISGWVEVQFTVLANGRADQPLVTAAEPANVFNSAAISAVKRASFEPGRSDAGQAVPVQTKLRIRFAAPGKS